MAGVEEDPRAIMDSVIQEAVTVGRTSLTPDNPLASFEFTSRKPDELRPILDLLDITDMERIAHDNHKKYVLSRNGTTSFVYLANEGRANGQEGAGGLNGMSSSQTVVPAQWLCCLL